MDRKTFNIKPFLNITLIAFACVIAIILYGTFRCKVKTGSFTDPLTKSITPSPFDKYLDGWGISHFLFFALLGYLYPYPTTILYSWILGVLWELLEFYAKDHPFYISKCNYTITTDAGTGWWYGRWEDIMMNSLGLLIGFIVATLKR